MRQIHDTNLVFLHIPKTAGMAVVSAFGLEHSPTDHMMSRPQDKAFLGSQYVRFLVFRDPFARFVSAYNTLFRCSRITTETAPEKTS